MNYQRNYISPYNIIISVIVSRIICVYYLECIPVSVDSHVEYFYLRHLAANADFAPASINITMLSDYTRETEVNIGNSSAVVVRSNCYMSYSIYALFSLDKHNFIYKSFSLIYYSYSFFQPFSLKQIAAYELSFFQSYKE